MFEVFGSKKGAYFPELKRRADEKMINAHLTSMKHRGGKVMI